VLSLVADGLNNREIAAALFVSVATVKTHINSIFAKLGVRDRAQAITLVRR
jgi:DNA-binding NarL/FixJ family response regulator